MADNKLPRAFGRPSLNQLFVPLVLALLALLLWSQPQWYDTLDWSRSHLEQGQWWRAITGHLLHSNTAHLLMNLGGLALIFSIHQPHYRTTTMAPMCIVMALLISLGLWWLPGTEHYVGLSAILHGLFTWGACKDIATGWRSGYLLLLGVLIKVGWEQISGGSEDIAALIDARVAVESHLLGVLSALLLFGLAWLYRHAARELHRGSA